MPSADQSTVLLLLHLQNEVVDPRGVVGARLTRAVDTVALIDVVVEAQGRADAAGVPTFHVVFEAVDRSCVSTARNLRQGAVDGFVRGGWGARIPERLHRPHDTVLPHSTMSAFAGTSLARDLRERGVEHVALGGGSTHLVVAATAFAAADEGFDVTVVADCCAAPDPAAHRAALAQVGVIGAVVPTFAGATPAATG